MTVPLLKKRYMLGGAALALALVAAALQLRAEAAVQAACEHSGGLTIRGEIPRDAVFVESPSALFAEGDPVAALAQDRLFNGTPVASWSGRLDENLLTCGRSGNCSGVMLTDSARAYLHREGGRVFLISAGHSPHCSQEPTGALPAGIAATTDYHARLLRVPINVCTAARSALGATYVISQQAVTAGDGNPLGGHAQLRAWRVFRLGQMQPVLEYNQLGVQTFGGKLSWVVSRLFGVPAPDSSDNRCRVDTDARSNLSHNANETFEMDTDYPIGRFVDAGAAR